MAIQRITTPPILDTTGQNIVTGLAGIANAVQPINIYLDVQMSIPVEGWSNTTPHTYTWLYNRITAECGIEVYFTEGAENVDMKYLEYDKIAGGIQFEIDEIPDAAIPLMVRIINAQTSAVIDPVDSTLVTENAVSGAVNVHEAIANHEGRIAAAEGDIDGIDDKLEEVDAELALRVKSVNGEPADQDGDVKVYETEFTHQIVTDDAQQSTGLFLLRTTGGDASLSDGPAKLVSISGRRVHTGEAAEQLNMTVNAEPRTAPDPITAELDAETFEAYVEEAGVYTIIYTGDWSTDPELYGITIAGDPLYGDSISVSWDGIDEPVMTVTAPRYAPAAITAEINIDTFKSHVSVSGTYTLSYTTEWSDDPADYGVTVTNTPINGDEIVIVYVKSNRGTIAVSNPSKFVSTGWNLYDNSTGKKYAKVKKYSTTYGFLIGGSYASLAFAETLEGAQTTITPVSGYFVVPDDGYVFVTGGDDTTYIVMTWSDWTEGYEGEFKTYEESVVDLSTIMTNFPYGLMQVGAVSDEINFSMMRAISRIERLAYTDQNLAYAEASGRAYEADTNYIYLVKGAEDVYTISINGTYTACDHGIEYIDGNVPVYIQTLYGQNLVDKLRTDVVTISAQTLTQAQKQQVCHNLGIGTLRDVPFAIEVADWTSVTGGFKATFNTAYVTSTCKWDILYSSSIKDYATRDFIADVKSGAGGIEFVTAVKPTGTITGTIRIIDDDDGRVSVVPQETVTSVQNGGTGETTVAGVKSAFGITALSEQIATLNSNKTNVIELQKTSVSLGQKSSWDSVYSEIANGYAGIVIIHFQNGANITGLVYKNNASYGSILGTTDDDSNPYFYTVKNGTSALRRLAYST